MTTEISSNCWIEIDRAALESNIVNLRRLAGEGVLFMAIVKANAYGHGIVEIAQLARESGVDWLGVFSVTEGVRLRKAGVSIPILVLGPPHPSEIPLAVNENLRLTVPSQPVARGIATHSHGQVSVHLKLETGTNRQGLHPEEVPHTIEILKKGGVNVEGIYTHFADIEDTTDHSFAERQLELFKNQLDNIQASGYEIPIAHTACSAATILFPSTYFNLVRVGISLYGLWPSRETRVSAQSLGRSSINLQPVMTWKTRIAQIKKLEKNDYIGYGCTYRTTRKTRLAVLPIGYADGYPRDLSDRAHVLVRGSRAPVRGRICMNMTLVDVTDIPSAAPGNHVVLLGAQGDEVVTADDLARLAGTINYEIVTRVAPYAPRIIV